MKDVTDKVQINWVSIQTDRNYYRQLTNKLLVREAQENPTAELAVVLAERLDKAMCERAWAQD